MKKQVLIIHGGTTFNNKKDYLNYLESQTIDIDRIMPGYDWKLTLGDDLGENYSVLTPKMPNSTYAKYSEWKIWFENILTVLNKEIILIGHSLGGIFLAKYLSENLIDNKITKLILIAAPFSDTPEEPLASFSLGSDFSKINQQVQKTYILHSTDDPVVPFSDSKLYNNKLTKSCIIAFKDKKHFNQESFPELVELLRKA